MAKTTRTAKPAAGKTRIKTVAGKGGETHQQTDSDDRALTTNQGVPISDNQNSLKSGARGPTLLEDFVLREKITHFDHERIPERIVHARGSGAHGYFRPYKDMSALTRAAFLRNPREKTRVFVRFSTVAGGAGSADTVRDVRGFAVKFYTSEGNFDLVGNNIPVFFIQDAMKFPDLVHSVKMEADRAFPQAASAHDTFWDFVSLVPESTHMLMWAMSDRGIPRSYRMMEGFGVHTFRFVNEKGNSTFVKFHWRPTIGSTSLIWDEAVKLAGADYDFHRRDLWNAIEAGDYPEFELGIQAFDEKTANKLGFDVLDPTKVIPEEIIPLQMIGKLVLDRNPDNFFAETEQVAFHPGHVVPGIDFTNDPLLQGRLFSYIDTQLSRLGGPNFHEIEINKPVCPMRNFQRDGLMRMAVAKGRVNYEPNSLGADTPRETPTGFASFPEPSDGPKLRQRPESFADHYSHARLFWLSMTRPEQQHIVSAFAFELAKVETIAIRRRVLGRLKLVHADLCNGVEAALGMEGEAETLQPAVAAKTMKISKALSLIAKAQPTIKGRKIGVLVTDGADAKLLKAVQDAAHGEGAMVEIVAPKIGGTKLGNGSTVVANHTISGGPSVLFDAVVLLPSADGVKKLVREAGAVAWVHDAFSHLKVIGNVAAAKPLMDKAGVEPDDGIVALEGAGGTKAFIAAAKQHRIWDREPKLRSPG
ncbi:catalase [Ferrovibrio terrae]|uniref:Catalase n=1 Tax=Ferrovibrio terrae TaxID=2594003 RepID=A0A516H5T4_9PROT|nr:catalase [Ferrovibrio terrae]QDO99040.1 catalase [Ferrovibrio terrae]